MKSKKRVSDFRPQRVNANKHTERGMAALESSIQRDGWIGAVTVAANHETFDGSARVETLANVMAESEPIVIETDGTRPIVVVRTDIPDADDPRARRLGVAANAIASMDWNPDGSILAGLCADDEIIRKLVASDDVASEAVKGFSETEVSADEKSQSELGSLFDKFIIPPFSVLDARQGYWQERKRAWLALGIQSEIGRGGGLLMTAEQVTTENMNYYRNRA